MISKLQPSVLGMAIVLSLGLSACGGGNDAAAPADKTADAAGAGKTEAPKDAPAAASVPTLADGPDVRAEERATLEDHLETIVVGGIVAAGYLDAAVHIVL